MTQVDLPPTMTHPTRRAALSDTTIVIAGVGNTNARTITIDLYKWVELPPNRFSTRRFELLNMATETAITVGFGGMPSCSCEAGTKGRHRGKCKHLLAMEALIREGALPEPRTMATTARDYSTDDFLPPF